MKYFTHQLLERFRSPDDDVAEAAEAEWDAAGMEYRSSRGRMPKSVERFEKKHCPHDAEIREVTRSGEVLTLRVRTEGGEDLELSFRLSGPVRVVERGASGKVYWAYEEFDVAEGGYEFRLMTHTGTELTVPFSAFRCRRLRVYAPTDLGGIVAR